MAHEKFNIAHLERLNDPGRFDDMPPRSCGRRSATRRPTPSSTSAPAPACSPAGSPSSRPRPPSTPSTSSPRWSAGCSSTVPPRCARGSSRSSAGEHAIPLATGEADLVVMINLHHELVDPVDELSRGAAPHSDRRPAARGRLDAQRRREGPASARPRYRRADRRGRSRGRLRRGHDPPAVLPATRSSPPASPPSAACDASWSEHSTQPDPRKHQ